jgi:hypothetical protein
MRVEKCSGGAIERIYLLTVVIAANSRSCSGIRDVLKVNYSSLLSGKFEFHAEWLRDEPCDATTTGQNKDVPVSTLSWKQGT